LLRIVFYSLEYLNFKLPPLILFCNSFRSLTACRKADAQKKPHERCGCPLGLRFHPDRPDLLYIADAFHGVVKVDVRQGTKSLVVSSKDARFGGVPPKLVDDLELDGDVVYFVDSSYEYGIVEHLDDILEALPRGRLFAYSERSGALELIAENLYFPNGLQLMPSKSEILVNECTTNRLIKYECLKLST
jgi:sugar lactone lactonase YvrE